MKKPRKPRKPKERTEPKRVYLNTTYPPEMIEALRGLAMDLGTKMNYLIEMAVHDLFQRYNPQAVKKANPLP